MENVSDKNEAEEERRRKKRIIIIIIRNGAKTISHHKLRLGDLIKIPVSQE